MNFRDIRRQWRETPWMIRSIWVMSLLLSVSSVTSISDVVFAWKGFILTGVQFYREWIREPFTQAFGNLGLHFDGTKSDLVMIAILFTTPLIRAQWYLERYVRGSRGLALVVVGVSVFWLVGIGMPGSKVVSWVHVFAVLVAYSTTLLIAFLNGETRLKVLLLGPIGFSVTVVLILAAINDGLHRTS